MAKVTFALETRIKWWFKFAYVGLVFCAFFGFKPSDSLIQKIARNAVDVRVVDK
jgi:hypothetical protein